MPQAAPCKFRKVRHYSLPPSTHFAKGTRNFLRVPALRCTTLYYTIVLHNYTTAKPHCQNGGASYTIFSKWKLALAGG